MSAWALWLGLQLSAEPAAVAEAPTVILLVGAPGTEDYGREFAVWADRWKQAAMRGGARVINIGGDGAKSTGTTDRETLQRTLTANVSPSAEPLWLVLIGHGTFDGRTAKFNLHGPDVSADELAAWLAPIERPTAVINCASASGPFIASLSRPGRVIVTATKSGFEQNFAQFGRHFADAVADPAADLNADGQTSLLEAFLTASRATAEFYRQAGRLATEHALLEDTGDGQAMPADWYRGVRPVQKPAGGAVLDGYRAQQFHLVAGDADRRLSSAQRQRRDELELAVIALRDRKAALELAAYENELETLLVELAELYERAESTFTQSVGEGVTAPPH